MEMDITRNELFLPENPYNKVSHDDLGDVSWLWNGD